ncbi:MAG: nitronate monooxygenase [Solirubrobacterales bacterium]|nr:nitronate monooxygenase [Solirubrobacterales bacterium]MBV9166833.1 nitronate monooxygenase [Solirubrobacterales bacterium]MBV9534244.1 nitronate monooxygenase [Solirubrobacterales bacterium]
MAGGPSTPELTASVCEAGGLGFVAAGYRTAEQLQADIARVRELTAAPFGVNLFSVTDALVDRVALDRYAEKLQPLARRYGVRLGEPRFDDDAFESKLALVCAERVAIVSFTFGCPSTEVLGRLHANGIAAWVTVTEPGEGEAATHAGADALVLQGVEAGGHRGTFEDIDGRGEIGLLALLRLIARSNELPLVASGGIADGPGIAAVLAAGARAAQIGTAFMRCPEAATSAAHRDALGGQGPTALTRAFSGRRARGIVNPFIDEHNAYAPTAYPHVHYLTAPLRSAARGRGDPEAINLWAGQAHALVEQRPAGELVRQWSADASAAIEQARRNLMSGD